MLIEVFEDQPFQQAGQRQRLVAQAFHAGLAEQFQRLPHGRHGQDRRVGKLPGIRAGRRHESLGHQEA